MTRLAFLVLVFTIAAPCVAHAEGQTVHRCIGEHGEISFSGLPCAGVDAEPKPASTLQSSAMAGDTIADDATGNERTLPTKMCPASEDALRNLIADAFTRRDANALAGVMRWDGVGGATAR